MSKKVLTYQIFDAIRTVFPTIRTEINKIKYEYAILIIK